MELKALNEKELASLYREVTLTQEDLAALERILEKGGEEP